MKRDDVLLWSVIALLLLGGGTAVYAMTRGLRNNNPGNIRKNSTQWQGLATSQTDPDYFIFVNATYGIRALAKTLNTYMSNYGLNTIDGIINRWAPPSENDTAAYIDDVESETGIDRNAKLTGDDLPAVVSAIIKHENGVNPYSDATIEGAVALA
jgi:hypothetical protein